MKAELLSSKVSEKNIIQQNQSVEEMEKKVMNFRRNSWDRRAKQRASEPACNNNI